MRAVRIAQSGDKEILFQAEVIQGKEEKMFSKINEALLRLVARFQREEGQALAEYGLILALIAVVAISALTLLGVAIAGKLSAITTAL